MHFLLLSRYETTKVNLTFLMFALGLMVDFTEQTH